MPDVQVNGITMHYERQGAGDPLILIPYLTADHACYAFQVAEYAARFTCISVDLRGTGTSDKPEGVYSTRLFAEDVAALMQALGIQKAHVSGLSLGAAVGAWLAIEHPEKVQSLSLHSGWTKTDPFMEAVIESWRVTATALGSVPETVTLAIFPWCFTPELYTARPEYIRSLGDFVKSRPEQPVDAFLRHAEAVITHNVEGQLERITAPTQITFGSHDVLTSTRFADRLQDGISDSELLIFEGCAHAPIYERVEEVNQKTLAFLQRHAS